MNHTTTPASSESATMEIRVGALCINSIGEPEFYWTLVNVTQEAYDNGEHYDACEESAENEGYEVKRVFDERDPAAKQLAELAGFFLSTSTEAHPLALVEDKPTRVVVRVSDGDITDVFADRPVELLQVNFDHDGDELPGHDDNDSWSETSGAVYAETVETMTRPGWFDELKAQA